MALHDLSRISMFLNASIFNDAIIAKLIRVMPFVLSAVCAAGAVAKLIG